MLASNWLAHWLFVILFGFKERINKIWKNKFFTEKGPKFKNLSDLVHLFGLLQNKKLYLNTWILTCKKQDMSTGN